jgi:hypothetical protein
MRKHPLMSYRGQPNWPPVWMWTGTGENKHPHGEVGALKEVHLSIVTPEMPASTPPFNRVYLFMEYRDSTYVGALLFDDAGVCEQIGKLLEAQCGHSLEEIGRLDLTHFL